MTRDVPVSSEPAGGHLHSGTYTYGTPRPPASSCARFNQIRTPFSSSSSIDGGPCVAAQPQQPSSSSSPVRLKRHRRVRPEPRTGIDRFDGKK
jgi:hypothetical protein